MRKQSKRLPYIHHIYKLNPDGTVGDFITTIKFKCRFLEWVREHLEKGGDRICFRLESWDDGVYREPYLFPIRKGKESLLFVRFVVETETKSESGKEK